MGWHIKRVIYSNAPSVLQQLAEEAGSMVYVKLCYNNQPEGEWSSSDFRRFITIVTLKGRLEVLEEDDRIFRIIPTGWENDAWEGGVSGGRVVLTYRHASERDGPAFWFIIVEGCYSNNILTNPEFDKIRSPGWSSYIRIPDISFKLKLPAQSVSFSIWEWLDNDE